MSHVAAPLEAFSRSTSAPSDRRSRRPAFLQPRPLRSVRSSAAAPSCYRRERTDRDSRELEPANAKMYVAVPACQVAGRPRREGGSHPSRAVRVVAGRQRRSVGRRQRRADCDRGGQAMARSLEHAYSGAGSLERGPDRGHCSRCHRRRCHLPARALARGTTAGAPRSRARAEGPRMRDRGLCDA